VAAFAELTDVQKRLDFALDEFEQNAVESALDDLSDEARFYAGQVWANLQEVPNLARVTVIKAVARWARNMNGYVISRAGDETVGWPEAAGEVGQATLSQREIKLLKAIGSGRTSVGAFGTISVVAYGKRVDADTYIAIQGSNRAIPFVDPSGW
jgi:hypothetical protein